MRKLEGKVALVTGASRGIGAAIAERLAADGASVVVNYVKAEREAEAVAERARRAGVRALTARADIGDPAQATRLVADTVRRMGRLDILVNNAVMINLEPMGAIDPARIRAQFATNVEGVIATVQAALAHLPGDGGRVINVSFPGGEPRLAGGDRLCSDKGRARCDDPRVGEGARAEGRHRERRRSRPGRDGRLSNERR